MADIPLQLPSLGNALMSGAHAGYFAGKGRLEQQQADEEQSAKPYVAKAMQGDQGAMSEVASRNPKTAMVLTQALARLDATKLAHVKGAADFTARASNAVLQADAKDRPAIYQQMLQEGRAQGFDLSTMPQQYDPSVDARLRFHRAQSKEVNDQLLKREEMEQRWKIHTTPGGGGGPQQIDMPGPGGGPTPMAPPAAPAGSRRVSELPPGVATPPVMPPTQAAGMVPPQAPVQTAQAAPGTMPPPMPGVASGSATADYQPTGQSPGPLKPEGVTPPGSPPVGGEAPRQPKRNGPVFEDEPTQFGYVQRGEKDKYGNVKPQTVEGGYLVFRDPKTNEHVLWKPQAPTKDHFPAGYEADPTAPGRLRAIPGGPADKQGPEIDPTLKGDELLATVSPTEAAQVKAIDEGRAGLPPWRSADPAAKRIRSLVFQYDKDFDDTVHASRQKTQNDFAAGDMSKQIANANKLIGHIGDLHEASAKLNNSDTPLFNAAGNLIAANRGDPRITEFNVAKQIALEEADKFFSGSGGTTVSGMEDMKKLINAAQSPQQLQGAMTQMEKMLQSQLSSYANKFNSGMKYTGDKAIKPADLLSEDARAGLKRIAENPLKGPAERARDQFNTSKAPAVGIVEQGYRFKGGDPSKRENWESAQ